MYCLENIGQEIGVPHGISNNRNSYMSILTEVPRVITLVTIIHVVDL